MDQGFGHMGAYMKWKYSNHTWIDSIPLITSSGTYYLNPLASPAGNCYKVISPYTNSDFYVLEYRQQAGLYESNLPGTGLLVYRITPLYTGNSYGPPDEVYIYRPDGTNSMNGNPSSACFSSQTGRISINDTTNPSGFLENGLPGGLMISDISYADSVISFTITISNTSAPTGFTATATGTSQIELGWTKDQDSDNVLLAYSLEPMACNPEMEVAYKIGDTIPGGGVVIYDGSASEFVHSGLNPATRYYYRIWSHNPGLVYSNGIDVSTLTNCIPIGFPFSESFNSINIPDCWSIQTTELEMNHWNISMTSYAGGTHDELTFFDWIYQQGYSRMIMTPFNTTGITKLNMSFRFFFNSLFNGATVRIQSSTDKINWTDEEWYENSVEDTLKIPELVSTSVSHNLNSPVTYISFTVQGNFIACGEIFIDDIDVTIAECDYFVVQTSAIPAEGGSVSGGGNYYPGQEITVSATPGNNWNFLYWRINGQIVSYQQDYSFAVESNTMVEAVFSSQQVSISLGISPVASGLTSGSGIYDKFQQVNLEASPMDGYEFGNWTENNQVVASTASYSFSAINSIYLVANFIPRQLSISLQPSPQVAGSCSGMGTFTYGTSDTIQACPAEGYQFIGWFENGSLVSTLSQYSFIVIEDHELSAQFFCPACNVNVIADPPQSGTLSGGGVYPGGSQATIMATANEGWAFSMWKEFGNEITQNSQYSFIVNQNRDLVADFLKIHSVNATVFPQNSGTVIGVGSYINGKTCTLIAIPNSGYAFRYWAENGDSITASNIYEFVVLTGRTFVAVFQSSNGQNEVLAEACSLYPNPTKGPEYFDFSPFSFSQPESVVITSSLGVISASYKIKPGESSIKLFLGNFPAGTYIVLLMKKHKCILSRKILVIK